MPCSRFFFRGDVIMMTTKRSTSCSATELSVSEPWFSLIKSGAKTIEGRLCKGKFADLKVGSALVISKAGADARSKRVVAVVTKTAKFPTFEALLAHEGLGRTLPGVAAIADGVAT